MERLSGIISVVQESRFQLVLNGGGTRLFVLAHDAPLDAEGLRALQHERVPVEVIFRPSRNLIAGEARAVSKSAVTEAAVRL